MKVHVFASDVMPLRRLPTSGGGLRSWQIVAGLEAAGVTVSHSMPGFTFLCKSNTKSFTAAEKALFWSPTNQHEILERVKPDVAIWCSPYGWSLPSTYRAACKLVVDLHGPTNVESSYIAQRPLQDSTRELIEKLTRFDHWLTVCEEQRNYFTGLLCAGGVPAADINLSLVPVAVPASGARVRKTSDTLSLIFAGGFYPWQDPSGILLRAARVLQELGGHLHICGTPHRNLSTAKIDRLLRDLASYSSVTLHGYLPRPNLLELYGTASCALDLMPTSLERRLAVTTRTVEYLAYGLPPIYNNYAPLAEPIARHGAGWCLDPDNLDQFDTFLRQLFVTHRQEIPTRSASALELSRTTFSLEHTTTPLAATLERLLVRPSRGNNRPTPRDNRRGRRPRVAVFTQDAAFVAQLRVVQPLDALKRAGLIDGYTVFRNADDQGPDSYDTYDAIWIQRTATQPVLDLVDDRPFLFDIDDLLVGRPAYSSVSLFQTQTITSLLKRRCALSVTTPRLHRLLGKYTNHGAPRRCFVTPNGAQFPRGQAEVPRRPSALVWTSSDAAALTTSYGDVVDAIGAFASAHRVPLYLIGRFHSRSNRQLPPSAIQLGPMEFWRHKAFLASQSTMVAVCPLETHGDEATLDFVAGKSDLKLVEFGGYNHPGVFSRAVPYIDTDLTAGVRADNTREAWTAALDEAWALGPERIMSEGEEIRRTRHIDVLARDAWWPALETVVLKTPLARAAITKAFEAVTAPDLGQPRGSRSPGHKAGAKNVFLFGAGAAGMQTLLSLPPTYHCVAFVDNDTAKQGTKVCGRPVIAPHDLSKHHYDGVLISSMFSSSIEEQLLRLGVPPSKIEKAFS